MSNHTPEPWVCHEDLVYFHDVFGGFSLRGCPNPEDTAHRIVTCVNACAGMEDPAAEIDELKRQRDELFSLVKAVVYHSLSVTVNGTRCAAFPWVEYEAMVNKAKGGEK